MSLIDFNSRSRRRRGGFTLIEIMIVVAIIVILVGITLAIGIGVKTRSQGTQTKATVDAVGGLMTQYMSKGGTEPTDAVDPTEQVLWVKAIYAVNPQALNSLNILRDSSGNILGIPDAWGTLIKYVPSTSPNNTLKQGYFQSAGPDRQFGTADDTFSGTAH